MSDNCLLRLFKKGKKINEEINVIVCSTLLLLLVIKSYCVKKLLSLLTMKFTACSGIPLDSTWSSGCNLHKF